MADSKSSPKNILGTLVSKLDYPVYITYNGETTMVSPRARTPNVEFSLLGDLPAGLSFISN